MMRTVSFIAMLMVSAWGANVASAGPLVYTGHSVSFEKNAFADPTLAASQDRILPDVAITRGDTRGLFNAAQEEAFVDNSSPAGTKWAFASNNPAATLSASNWAALTFDDWQTSLGGAGSLGTAILDGGAVLHLLEQDIYLDIEFTDWGTGSGAGGRFAYDRAELTPSADVDRDGDVDGQDFLTWQRNVSATFATQSEGDANFDGTVDANDLTIWQDSYGSLLPAVLGVPEPTVMILTWTALLGLVLRRKIWLSA
jgi:hypothetical protein